MTEGADSSDTNETAEREITERFLHHLAMNSDDELIREMASEVRRGHLTVADGLTGSTYTDALAPRVDEFTQWYRRLSEEEREKEAKACAAEIARLEATIVGESKPVERRDPGGEGHTSTRR